MVARRLLVIPAKEFVKEALTACSLVTPAKAGVHPPTGLYFEAETNLWRQCMNRRLTAIIEREGDGFVALCPELDVASQGASIEEARDNLREALELFFVTASPNEVEQRLSGELYVTQVEVEVS